MDNALKEKIDNFIEEFLKVPEVKQYLLLKKQIEDSKELANLANNLKNSQKNMALSFGTKKYEENKALYFEAKKAYDSYPLVVNYNMAQEEVNYLLEELQNKLK